MARKTKEEALETRERILNAAIDVFEAKGVSQSSLEEIAEAAQVTRGAIYWHFKNKADIFSALHDQLHVPVMEDLIKREASPSENPLQDLIDFCVFYLKDLEANERKRKIFTLFILKCDYSGEMAIILEKQTKKKQESLKLTKGFFKTAISKNIISKDSDPDMMALSFYCYICGIMNEFLRDPALFNLKKQARPLVEQFFRKV